MGDNTLETGSKPIIEPSELTEVCDVLQSNPKNEKEERDTSEKRKIVKLTAETRNINERFEKAIEEINEASETRKIEFLKNHQGSPNRDRPKDINYYENTKNIKDTTNAITAVYIKDSNDKMEDNNTKNVNNIKDPELEIPNKTRGKRFTTDLKIIDIVWNIIKEIIYLNSENIRKKVEEIISVVKQMIETQYPKVEKQTVPTDDPKFSGESYAFYEIFTGDSLKTKEIRKLVWEIIKEIKTEASETKKAESLKDNQEFLEEDHLKDSMDSEFIIYNKPCEESASKITNLYEKVYEKIREILIIDMKMIMQKVPTLKDDTKSKNLSKTHADLTENVKSPEQLSEEMKLFLADARKVLGIENTIFLSNRKQSNKTDYLMDDKKNKLDISNKAFEEGPVKNQELGEEVLKITQDVAEVKENKETVIEEFQNNYQESNKENIEVVKHDYLTKLENPDKILKEIPNEFRKADSLSQVIHNFTIENKETDEAPKPAVSKNHDWKPSKKDTRDVKDDKLEIPSNVTEKKSPVKDRILENKVLNVTQDAMEAKKQNGTLKEESLENDKESSKDDSKDVKDDKVEIPLTISRPKARIKSRRLKNRNVTNVTNVIQDATEVTDMNRKLEIVSAQNDQEFSKEDPKRIKDNELEIPNKTSGESSVAHWESCDITSLLKVLKEAENDAIEVQEEDETPKIESTKNYQESSMGDLENLKDDKLEIQNKTSDESSIAHWISVNVKSLLNMLEATDDAVKAQNEDEALKIESTNNYQESLKGDLENIKDKLEISNETIEGGIIPYIEPIEKVDERENVDAEVAETNKMQSGYSSRTMSAREMSPSFGSLDLIKRPFVLATHLVPSLPIELFEIVANIVEKAIETPVVLLHESKYDRLPCKEIVDMAILPADTHWDDGILLGASFVFDHQLNKTNSPFVYVDVITSSYRPPYFKSIMNLRGHTCILPNEPTKISATGLMYDFLREKGENPTFFSRIQTNVSQMNVMDKMTKQNMIVGVVDAPVLKCYKNHCQFKLDVLHSLGPLPPYRIMVNKYMQNSKFIQPLTNYLLNIHNHKEWMKKLSFFGITGFARNSMDNYSLNDTKPVTTNIRYY